jgi:hypothetical protein
MLAASLNSQLKELYIFVYKILRKIRWIYSNYCNDTFAICSVKFHHSAEAVKRAPSEWEEWQILACTFGYVSISKH